MIILHSVSKETGRRQFKRLVLDNVNWLIQPHAKVVVLGHRTSGVDILPGIIAGTVIPTAGWVERRGEISLPGGLVRFGFGTLHQLVERLSQLYRVDSKDVTEFIAQGLDRRDVFDVLPRMLPLQLQKQLTTILTYAFPYDFYIFQHSPVPAGEGRFQTFCQRAYELRSREAGIIVTTNSSKTARRLGSDMMGALIYQGHFTLYKSLADAIAVFESLPPEHHSRSPEESQEQQDSEADFDLM